MPYKIMGIKLKDNSKTQSRKDERLNEPGDYTVVLLNDDYTTREFVVEILKLVFHKSHEEATRIMLNVHRKGRGAVGIYTWDIAVTKAMQVHDIAKQYEYPLQCVVDQV
jgi:ATP-dependent Clp protease adaptor protein ClpS